MFRRLFEKKPKQEAKPGPAKVYADLRDRILKTAPGEVGITPSAETPNVWGVLMEMGYAKAVATLVSLADGTTSMYLSNGGGMLGGGQHAAVTQASRSFSAIAEKHLQRMRSTESFPLPALGMVRFYVLTFSGAYTAEAEENVLRNPQHELSSLYGSGQEVITQVRLAQERPR